VVVDGRGSKETRKTTLQSEWRSALKKSLTEPALLEMSGNPNLSEGVSLSSLIVPRSDYFDGEDLKYLESGGVKRK